MAFSLYTAVKPFPAKCLCATCTLNTKFQLGSETIRFEFNTIRIRTPESSSYDGIRNSNAIGNGWRKKKFGSLHSLRISMHLLKQFQFRFYSIEIHLIYARVYPPILSPWFNVICEPTSDLNWFNTFPKWAAT